MTEYMNVNGKEISVKQFRNDWALALMSQGVIVRLSVKRWRGTAGLSFDQLGFQFESEEVRQFMSQYITLGSHKLLPPQVMKEMEVLERRARKNLDSFSFSTVWGKFVPFRAFDTWDEVNNVIKNDFMELATSMGDRYDDIVGSVQDDYRSMAKDVWGRLHPSSESGPPESFVTNFVLDVVSKIPSRMEIVGSFKYDTTYFIVPMPSFIENNLSKARSIQRESEAADFESSLERNTKTRIADEYVRRKQELIDGFLESTVVSMRSHIADLCNVVLDSIGKQPDSKDVNKNHVNKIKRMVSKVKLLNFYDDEEILGLLNEIENEVDKFKGQRDKDIIVKKLRQVVAKGKEEFLPKNFNPSIDYLDIDV